MGCGAGVVVCGGVWRGGWVGGSENKITTEPVLSTRTEYNEFLTPARLCVTPAHS